MALLFYKSKDRNYKASGISFVVFPHEKVNVLSTPQRDLDRKAKCSYVRSHTMDMESGEVLSSTGPQEVKDE